MAFFDGITDVDKRFVEVGGVGVDSGIGMPDDDRDAVSKRMIALTECGPVVVPDDLTASDGENISSAGFADVDGVVEILFSCRIGLTKGGTTVEVTSFNGGR